MEIPAPMSRRVSKRVILALLPVVFAMGSIRVYAGVNVWTSRGPEGGFVGPPVIDPQDPSTLYVSAAGELFKSTDAARRWSELGPAPRLPDGAVVRIVAVDPQNSSTLYGVSYCRGPLKSTDGGATWSEASSGLTGIPCATGSPMLLVIDPKSASTLYVTTGTGLFKSIDGAASWSAVGSGLPDQLPDGRPFFSLHALVIDPQNPSTLYAATALTLGYGGVVFKSTDGAASWSAINSGLTRTGLQITFLAIDPKNPDTLYAISPSTLTLFKSTDAGSSWTVANAGFASQALAIDPQDSSTLYAPSDRGVLKSVDGGGTWRVILAGPPAAAWVIVAEGERHPSPSRSRTRPARGPSTVYASAGGLGILKSTDGGTTWATANSGLTATQIGALAVNPQKASTLYAGVYAAGIFKSTDGARTWSANLVLLSASYVYGLAVDPQNPSTVYATTNWGFNNTAGAFKSTDEGRNWVKLDVPGVLAIDPQDPSTLYGLGGFKSTDGGASWVKLVFPQSASITALAIDPQDRSTLYAAGDVGGPCEFNPALFKSADGGRSWSSTSLGSLGCMLFIDRLVADPRNPGTAYATGACIDGGCPSGPYQYRTTDGGATWGQWELPEHSSLVTVDPQGTIYARTFPTGLIRSTDGGTTWSAVVTTGLTSNISVLAFDAQDPNHLYAGTGTGGVFEITLAPEEQ